MSTSGQVIVDASLALKWVLTEVYTPEAVQLLTDWTADQTTIVAPGWFACEVANALYQKVRTGVATLADIDAAIETILDAVVLRDVEPATARRAVAIADELGQKASYDSAYLAVAEREGCELWTADERFHAAAVGLFPFVHHIAEVKV
jgi:predicted nucleic acid-binding protein